MEWAAFDLEMQIGAARVQGSIGAAHADVRGRFEVVGQDRRGRLRPDRAGHRQGVDVADHVREEDRLGFNVEPQRLGRYFAPVAAQAQAGHADKKIRVIDVRLQFLGGFTADDEIRRRDADGRADGLGGEPAAPDLAFDERRRGDAQLIENLLRRRIEQRAQRLQVDQAPDPPMVIMGLNVSRVGQIDPALRPGDREVRQAPNQIRIREVGFRAGDVQPAKRAAGALKMAGQPDRRQDLLAPRRAGVRPGGQPQMYLRRHARRMVPGELTEPMLAAGRQQRHRVAQIKVGLERCVQPAGRYVDLR